MTRPDARLTLISHAMTDAMSAGRFPVDEPLSEIGRRQAGALHTDDRALAGPERRTRETAELLGLRATSEPRLADLDCGQWRGEELQNIPQAGLRDWLTDPAAAPHGGESIVELIERVAGWMNQLHDVVRTVAVTHPAVVRAAVLVALDAPPKSFWRIDVAPVSHTVLHRRGGAWTLRI